MQLNWLNFNMLFISILLYLEAAVLATPNPCFSSPCRDGGSCFSYSRYGCVDAYACRYPNPCDSSPCKQDRVCSHCAGRYYCLDPCLSSPCRDGICTKTTRGDGYTCPQQNPCKPSPCRRNDVCDLYCGGSQCRPSDEDPCMSSPCPDGGSCIWYGRGYECRYPEDIPCVSNPCQDGGTCIPESGGYTCRYPTSPCTSQPCQGGETCVPASDGYTCVAPNPDVTCVPNCRKEILPCQEQQLVNVHGGCLCVRTECNEPVYSCSGWCPSSYTPITQYSLFGFGHPMYQDRCTSCKATGHKRVMARYHCTRTCMCDGRPCRCLYDPTEYDVYFPLYSATSCSCERCGPTSQVVRNVIQV